MWKVGMEREGKGRGEEEGAKWGDCQHGIDPGETGPGNPGSGFAHNSLIANPSGKIKSSSRVFVHGHGSRVEIDSVQSHRNSSLQRRWAVKRQWDSLVPPRTRPGPRGHRGSRQVPARPSAERGSGQLGPSSGALLPCQASWARGPA